MADLYSPAVFGRARNVENASEAEAHMQAHLQAALINARMQRDLAHFKGDAAGEADWQRNIDWLSGVLADHETRVSVQKRPISLGGALMMILKSSRRWPGRALQAPLQHLPKSTSGFRSKIEPC